MATILTSTGVTYPDGTTQANPAAQYLLSTTTITSTTAQIDLSISPSQGYSSYMVVLDNLLAGGYTAYTYVRLYMDNGTLGTGTTRLYYGQYPSGIGTNSGIAGTATTVYGSAVTTNYMSGTSGTLFVLPNPSFQTAVVTGNLTWQNSATSQLGEDVGTYWYTNSAARTFATIRIAPSSGYFNSGTVYFYGII